MKVVVEHNDLVKALRLVRGIVKSTDTIPILNNILVTAESERLVIRATTLDLEMSARIRAEVAERGETTVPGNMFFDVASRFPSGSQIEIVGGKASTTLTIRAGTSEVRLRTLPAADFPATLAHDFSHSFVMPSAAMALLCKRTAHAVDVDGGFVVLEGIHFQIEDGLITTIATDRHQLARAGCRLPLGADGMPGITVPALTAKHMVTLASHAEDVSIDVSERAVAVHAGNVTLVSKLIDGDYPDTSRLIPREKAHDFKVDREFLVAAVERVAAITRVKDGDRILKFGFDKHSCTIATRKSELGDATAAIEGEFSGPALAVGLNGEMVLSALTMFQATAVTIRLISPQDPVVIIGAADEEAMAIIMPALIEAPNGK